MSEKSVKAFFAKMEGDKTLLAKVGALHEQAKKDLNVAIADLVKIGASEGFEFSAEDYAKARTPRHEGVEAFAEKADKLGGCNSNWTCARVKTM